MNIGFGLFVAELADYSGIGAIHPWFRALIPNLQKRRGQREYLPTGIGIGIDLCK
jgi:hypothetical protein